MYMTYACAFIHELNTTKLLTIVNSNTCFDFFWKDVYCRLYSTLLHCTEYTVCIKEFQVSPGLGVQGNASS